MKEQDYLDQNLRELFKSAELRLHMPADRKANVLNELLGEPTMFSESERSRMPWIKLAVAAMVLLAIVLGICLMDGAGVAFADILENIQQRGYTFTYWSRQKDGELKEMGRGMVLQPGLIRWDMPDDQWKGLALVADAINHQMRWVTTTGKDLGEVKMPGEVQEDPNRYQSEQNFMFGPVEELWGLVDGTEESLGSTTRDGVEVVGYRVEKPLKFQGEEGMSIYTIWADASTAMPHEVTIETRDPAGKDDGLHLVLTNFDFTADIDESLFGLGPAEEPKPIDEAKFIVRPGVGMSELPLGADQAKITEVLGQPDFKIGDQVYQYTGLAVIARDGKVYAFHCGDIGKTDSQHVKKCIVRTREGIGMGSTAQDVARTYGQPDNRREVKVIEGGVQWLYRSTGTVFGFHSGKVHFMLFQQPIQKK
ncbi:MAG TPA: hypothetical protein DIU00_23755 [Phycisphaerales bacterium]|mgnify:CR=1 FL=1|nr:hypothetical protein [Phycisphaerales bacterium]